MDVAILGVEALGDIIGGVAMGRTGEAFEDMCGDVAMLGSDIGGVAMLGLAIGSCHWSMLA